jgi:hypothetical protein
LILAGIFPVKILRRTGLPRILSEDMHVLSEDIGENGRKELWSFMLRRFQATKPA